mgnify:CR=1 FL=1
MPKIEMLIDNYLKYSGISIGETKITASNSFIYIPAKLHLHPIKPAQHFNIDEIECSLLLNNSEISNSTKKLCYNSINHSHDLDILFKFIIPDNNIKKIEDKRKGGDVELGLNLNFYLDLLSIQGSKIKGKKTSPARLYLNIFRSQWEDIILPAFGYSQKKANSILFRTWEFLKKNWSAIFQLAHDTWDVVKVFLKF